MTIWQQVQDYLNQSGLGRMIGLIIVMAAMSIGFGLLSKIEKWFSRD